MSSHILLPVRHVINAIDATFSQALKLISARFPEASVQHVGSTSLAPLLCRSVVDLDIAVEAPEINSISDAIVEMHELASLKLPVCVSVRDRELRSDALRVRESLACSPVLLGEFLGLQKRCIKRYASEYKRAKQSFFAEILANDSSATSAGPADLPYRIELESERMILRSPLATDAEAQAEYRIRNRKRLERNGASLPARTLTSAHWEKLATEQHILRWNHKALTFLIFRKNNSQYIGACIFSGFVWGPFRSCNFGYHIDGSVEGQGYMKEAAIAALDYIFNQWGIFRVVANYDEKNIRSGKLLERLGFEVEGCARDWIEVENARRNAITTALLRSDWERQNSHRRDSGA